MLARYGHKKKNERKEKVKFKYVSVSVMELLQPVVHLIYMYLSIALSFVRSQNNIWGVRYQLLDNQSVENRFCKVTAANLVSIASQV